ncbi:MAG: helix-turn-helix transcriptional regulator [Clostridia bacterium]|nr:helix-turn-helix transcriptional regulator [Clostridia bacterium]
MTDERKTLAKKIKNYRKEHNLSQMEFAEECGISPVSLCRIERRNSNCSIDTLDLISVYMNETISQLLQNPEIYTYCLIPTTICIDDTEVLTYGIGALKNNVMLEYVLDISDDHNAVYALMKLCEKEKLEPIHLKEIVENFLVE